MTGNGNGDGGSIKIFFDSAGSMGGISILFYDVLDFRVLRVASLFQTDFTGLFDSL
jgi:hypothetical protein